MAPSLSAAAGEVMRREAERRGRRLLAIARDSIEAWVLGRPEQDWSGTPERAWLHEPGATFVTLKRDGELRGCMGTLEARRPLLEDLRHNARAACRDDPRFPPLAPGELAGTSVEVSLLSPLERVPCASEEEAIAELARGRDGWLIESPPWRGTFLPQVWESLPVPRDFLLQLKRKAGMPSDFWNPGVRLYRYTVEKWSE